MTLEDTCKNINQLTFWVNDECDVLGVKGFKYCDRYNMFYCSKKNILNEFLYIKDHEYPAFLLYPENFQIPIKMKEVAEHITSHMLKGARFGIQTNSTSLINRIRYRVFKGQLNTNRVTIYYKEKNHYNRFRINERGKYIDDNNEVINFPEGFFDSELNELLEMI